MTRLAKVWTGAISGIPSRRLLRLALGGLVVALSVAILGWMIYANRQVLLTYRWQVNYAAVALVFVWYSAALLLAVAGWDLIMDRLTGRRDFRRNLKLYSYSNLMRRLPGAPWWLFGRVYLYEQDGVGKSVTAVGSVVESAVIALSGLLVYLVSQLLGGRQAFGLDRLLIAVLLLFGVLGSHPRVIRAAGERLGWKQLPDALSWRDILAWTVIYGGVWLLGGPLLMSGINVIFPLAAVDLPGLIGAWTLSGLASMALALAPTSLGVKEVTLVLMLQPYMPAPLAVVVAILLRVELTLAETVWATLAVRL